MKLRSSENPSSTQPRIFEHYEHPWYEFNKDNSKQAELIKPNPQSQAAVKKAKFVDKTYKWKPKTP